MKVGFASKCWEKDWAQLVFGGFAAKEKAIGYPFDHHYFVYNNGTPPSLSGYHTAELSDRVLSFFNLYEEDFKGGYNYSIGELTAIWLAHSCDYLCYVQGDCTPTSGDWVTEGIDILEKDPSVSAVSPLSEVNTWHGSDNRDQFFSDQAFLIRIPEFRKAIYEGGPDIPEYPPHGGDSFEKKVAQYLRRNGTYRHILTNHWYVH